MLTKASTVDEFLQLANNLNIDQKGKQKSDVLDRIDIDNDPVHIDSMLVSEIPSSDDENDTEWFENAINQYIKQKGQDAFMTAEDLRATVWEMLSSETSDDELQANLADILGFDHLELVIDLIQGRKDIINLESKVCTIIEKKKSETNKQAPPSQPQLMTEADIEQKRLNNQARLAEEASNLQFSKTDPKYPHVYREHAAGNTLSAYGTKYALPVGTERKQLASHEEVVIPHSDKKANRFIKKLVEIKDLDPMCRGTFHKYKSLNQMQSLVYPVGYKTNENMLVCAPTGAGKTDVALLTMLQCIQQHSTFVEQENSYYDVQLDEFKIVYVAPLKALAAEIVEKMGKRLAWLGISVRELTGDMQLTKKEITETQIIVTTPEKWDVVTRKSTGDNELVQKVKLLIIDEVHLLHEDRGAVIESLVARTLRQVESTQSLIRVVGLSATLPNFVDVSEFLRVNPLQGLFFFDQSFRPVPLEQMFLGVRGKAGSRQAMENLDRISYEKLVDMVSEGHQVMVFVHSRKDTVKTSRTYISMAQNHGDIDLFNCEQNSSHATHSREMTKFKNKDMKELFQHGFGVHHAGMLRAERTQTEKMFMSGAIKVLCCTATLAWGVNLPAAVVIIKGTQVYDAKRGGFVDLGISDVLQIFGRAGRPQFEKYGTGILTTTSDRLDHYLGLITQQHPIESKLQPKLADCLNAEISLGTVTNLDEAVQWLGYTYLYVRMRKNPLAYGMNWSQLSEDPLLGERRRTLLTEAARRLHEVQMIIFDEKNTGSFIAKDTGRVASDFYLLNSSIEVFNHMMKPLATEADILSMLSMSGEFDSIKSRQEEEKELTKLRDDDSPCQVAGTIDTTAGKTNVLLQAWISRAVLKEASLVSDAAYVGQNATRISRALFLVSVNRRWGRLARMLLGLCKSIEKRMWSFEHPLAQFDGMPTHVLRNLESKEAQVCEMKEMSKTEIGDLIHNHHAADKVLYWVDRFPLLHIDASIAPVTKNVLRIHVELQADFRWETRIHGKAQSFWVWVEDSESFEILHSERILLSKNKVQEEDPHIMDFTIPLSDPIPAQVVVRVISDYYAGAESSLAVSFQHLVRPDTEPVQTKLLRLRPLPVTALHNPQIEQIYSPKFQFFNPMQTMCFHTLYHKNTNVLLGSPTGSGKTVAAELAIWAAFRDHPKSKIVYIAPMKALVRERVDDWKKRLLKPTGRKLVELTGDTAPDANTIRNADIIITTPEKFDGISRSWQTRKFVQQVSLIIMDEIHLLASDRGPILEMIVSRMNYVAAKTGQPVRLLGMSTAVANATDMASWLQVEQDGLFNFPQSVRPVPLQMYIDGFPDNLGFCPLMKTMNKPAFLAIKTHSPTKPVLIFVASRRQTRITAQDLIQLCGMEENPRRFLKMNDEELEQIVEQIEDETLKLSVQFGIVLHHAGLVDSDRRISHELFANNKVQILVATSTLAWGVNLPAYLVIIKGTQFFDKKIEGYRDMDLTDVLQMMGRAGRPAFDTSGVAIVYTKQSTKAFYKYFLNSGFPVESSLHKLMEDHIGAEISSGSIRTRQDALDFLMWTFLFRRIHKNPTYYGIEDATDEGVNKWVNKLMDNTLNNLTSASCLEQLEDGQLIATPFLGISSYYYLSHKTIRLFLQRSKRNAGFGDLLFLLAKATEYDELPVRHNEDLINEELSKESRYPASVLDMHMGYPPVKVFLLVQAALSRQELPISDYALDTISVLDQSLRILQAMVDTFAELGILSTVLKIVQFMQCIKQKIWDTTDPLGILPGLRLKEGAGEDMENNEWNLMNVNKVEDPVSTLGVNKRAVGDFNRVVSTLPIIDIKAYRSATKVQITLQHVNKKVNSEKLYSKFHKPQKESWFVVVSLRDEDKIVRLRRVSPKLGKNNNAPMECNIELEQGEISKERDLTVYIVNDTLPLKYQVVV